MKIKKKERIMFFSGLYSYFLNDITKEKLKQIPHEIKIYNSEDILECTFNSLTEAEKETKINNGHISKVCQNKKSFQNFKFAQKV